jgi:lysophospholipase L1-like esterase
MILDAVQDPSPEKSIPLEDKRILILGDSITQDGRYVSYFEYFLQKHYPKSTFDIISAGLASETVSGLSEPGHAGGAFPRPELNERLVRALRDVKPQLVLACYGMNDGIMMEFDAKRFELFQAGISGLLKACDSVGAKLVLITPPIFEIEMVRGYSPYREYEGVLAKYATWEMTAAPKGVLAVIDIHSPMLAAKKHAQSEKTKWLTMDGVHPGDYGHYVMAVAVANGLGLECDPGSEMAQKAADEDPLFKLVHAKRQLRSSAWLNYIGYNREKNVSPHTGDIAEAERRVTELQAKIDLIRRKKHSTGS